MSTPWEATPKNSRDLVKWLQASAVWLMSDPYIVYVAYRMHDSARAHIRRCAPDLLAMLQPLSPEDRIMLSPEDTEKFRARVADELRGIAKRVMESLGMKTAPPGDEQAFRGYQYAEEKAGRKLTDEKAYSWLKKNGPTELELPSLSAWLRALGRGRTFHGEHKYRLRNH